MKKTRHEILQTTVHQYLKRRSYTDTEISQKKECKHSKGMESMAVETIVKSESGMDNILTYSSISGDATAYDQQFHRLKQFIKEAVEPHRTELKGVLFPMFVHVYLELICNGHKTPAQKFYARHSNLVWDDEGNRPLMEDLVKLGGLLDVHQNKEASDFRDHKYELNLSRDDLQYLMRHLKVEDNMIMLQVFNQHIKVIVHSGNQNNLELLDERVSRQSTQKGESLSVKTKVKVEDEVSLKVLEECIKHVRDGPPCLPSICFYTFLNAYQGLICSTISSDNTLIAGCFEDSAIRLWSLVPKVLTTAPSVCDNSRIQLGSNYEDACDDITQVKIKEEEMVCLRAHSGSVYKTCFTPDNQYLLSCSEDTSIRLWDLKTNTNVVSYHGHNYPVWDIDVSAMGSNFVSCSHDHTAKLWSTDRLFPLRSYIGHSCDVDCVAFHPNGNYVATGSSDKTVRLWSAQEGKSVRLLQGHRSGVLTIAFSPDGKYLVSTGEDRRIRVWDLGSGQLFKELRGHTDTVYALSFNKDSSLLASGGLDCCIRLWDTRKGTNSTSMGTEGHTSSELLGAYPTKSATVNFLRYASYNLLQAAGPI